jgi:hypothetical protein
MTPYPAVPPERIREHSDGTWHRKDGYLPMFRRTYTRRADSVVMSVTAQ